MAALWGAVLFSMFGLCTEIVFTGTPTPLMRALDFDNDDLLANRQGRLSVRQQARLQTAFQSSLQSAQLSTTLVASVLTAMAAWLAKRLSISSFE